MFLEGNLLESEVMGRRPRLFKRRYKSGLPLSTERGDEDLIDEAHIKHQLSEAGALKVSKDDSGKHRNYIVHKL